MLNFMIAFWDTMKFMLILALMSLFIFYHTPFFLNIYFVFLYHNLTGFPLARTKQQC